MASYILLIKIESDILDLYYENVSKVVAYFEINFHFELC